INGRGQAATSLSRRRLEYLRSKEGPVITASERTRRTRRRGDQGGSQGPGATPEDQSEARRSVLERRHGGHVGRRQSTGWLWSAATQAPPSQRRVDQTSTGLGRRREELRARARPSDAA